MAPGLRLYFVCEVNDDPKVTDNDGDVANFLVHYEYDDEVVPSALYLEHYNASREAPTSSWYIVAE